ncbi:hypothetical protein EK21DRAFT_98700 [Setomelanomma holmii]|uniref:Purine-cytosine permease n=1 Tax=Setomelanomma holmii TaxID=210430 RepID=A0A9P4LMM8_9PLEO|nr:hypothetical protein EK21DRAFT_98700 [Setomelanomma holmii]
MDPTPRQPSVGNDEKTIFAPNTNLGHEMPTHEGSASNNDNKPVGKMRRAWQSFERQLVAYNLESRGIQRVEPEERQDLRLLGYSQVAIMWFSVNLAANNITLGMLGPAVFALGFLDSCLLSVFGALVGSLVVAYIATFGPKSGNRTMIFSRYILGWYPSKIVVILNIIVLLGYGMIDCVVAGQILSAVADGSMSLVVGIIIVAIIAWLITTFGYQIFHYYERWAWLPQLIVLCILAGVAGPQFNRASQSHGDENPSTIIGNRISFFGLTLAAAITYGGGAADYFVYYPEHASSWRIFAMTLTGLMCSFTFAFILGIGLACGTLLNTSWEAAYGVSQGALIVEAYRPLGSFGSFCGVVVALGLVANLIVPTYSSGIDAQILGRWAGAVPRVIWNTVGVIIYTVCALAGRAHLAEIFTNFLALMGYWVSVWIAIILEEHLIFRRTTSFNWEVWNQKKKLPLGIAAFVAFVVGWVGAILSMAQVWYLGPIAKLVGTYGADMGNYVGFAWAALVYPPLRLSGAAMPLSTKHRSGFQSDSFSDLAVLMKAKKVYAPRAAASSRPLLSLSPPSESYETVASFLRTQNEDQNQYPSLDPNSKTPAVSGYQQKLDHLDALTNQINNYQIEDETERRPRRLAAPPSHDESSSLAGWSPLRPGPIDPPTPAESVVHLPQPAYDRAHEPAVRVTKAIWDSLNEDLRSMTHQIQDLKHQLSSLTCKYQALLDVDHEAGAQVGKLRYQNEANREQKAAMGRFLAQKEVEIKKQQVDLENLNNMVANLRSQVDFQRKGLGEAQWLRIAMKDTACALEEKSSAVQKLEDLVGQLKKERDDAMRAQVNSGDHAKRAQNLADTLSKREKLIAELRQKNVEEQMRVSNLEDEVERLREQVDQGSIDELKEKLREKSSQCDRLRTQLKATEHQLKVSQSRLSAAANGGDILRGAVHLVIPDPKGKLPKTVAACSECYAKNVTCDGGAICRPCIDSNTACSRWRCSLKHRLGECNRAPCSFPHDSQGWLIMPEPRPVW